jgi:hypothetical protein
VLPGFCSALETLPILTINGATDANGGWTATVTTVGPMYYFPRVTIYAQYAFLDAGLPNGVGVSNCSPITFPPSTLARIYATGSDTATTGSREANYPYGLVTGFDI